MDNKQEDLSQFIRYLMRGDADPLIQEFGFNEILNALASYCARQAVCGGFSEEEFGYQKWKLTEGLLQKASVEWAPEQIQEDISEINAEAINRFLQRLSGNALSALGSPPRVAIETHEVQMTPTGAEKSQGWYEPYKIYQTQTLLLYAPTYDHCCALAAAYPAYVEAARGLFQGISFKYPGCKYGFSVAVE